jgi:hypothetical protein
MAAESPPEALLQYAWQTLAFDTQGLRCTDGQPVALVQPGRLNTDQGPDFSDARIRIGDALWAGPVEIHRTSADWYAHGHDRDPAYNAVVLHVVAHSTGQPVLRADGTAIPELELGPRLAPELLSRSAALLAGIGSFPCANLIHQVQPFYVRRWLQRLGWDRIEQKAARVRAIHRATGQDWQQTAWVTLARAFGTHVNKEAFEAWALRLPVRHLQRLADQPASAEALVLGSAGFANSDSAESVNDDSYWQTLLGDWAHLRAKHQLADQPPVAFRHARLRPPNFPELRLVQLAALLCTFPNLIQVLEQPRQLVDTDRTIAPSDFWRGHFRAATPASRPASRALSVGFRTTLLINCVVPVALCYGEAKGETDHREALMGLLEELPAESNRTTAIYEAAKIRPGSALESQGMLLLEAEYCTPKHCLRCEIGHRLLRQS